MTYLGNESLGRKLSGDDRKKMNLSDQPKKEEVIERFINMEILLCRERGMKSKLLEINIKKVYKR